MSPRRIVHLLSLLAAATVAVAVAVQARDAQTRAESAARIHAARLASVVAQTAQAAHAAPRVVDAALSEHLAAEAALLLELAGLAAAVRVPDRDIARRLDAVASASVLKTLWWTDGKGAIRARAENGEPTGATAAALWPPFAEAAARPGTPVAGAAEQSEDDGRVVKMAGVVAVDGRGGAVVGADGGRLAELARLLGVDGVIDSVLAGQAADSVWLLDKEGRVLAQGAMVAHAGGAFADPEPVAAALARDAAASGRAVSAVDYAATVDGVFAAAPMVDRQGDRLGAALIRLPLEGRRSAERDAAAAAAAAAAALLLAGFVAGRLVDA